jgi:hypothetical protein
MRNRIFALVGVFLLALAPFAGNTAPDVGSKLQAVVFVENVGVVETLSTLAKNTVELTVTNVSEDLGLDLYAEDLFSVSMQGESEGNSEELDADEIIDTVKDLIENRPTEGGATAWLAWIIAAISVVINVIQYYKNKTGEDSR